MNTVIKGDTVRFMCRGFLENGEPFEEDSKAPMVMKAGLDRGSIIGQCISRALVGMRVRDSKAVKIPAEKAFGPYDPSLRLTLPRGHFPEEVQPGDVFELRFDQGGGDSELKEAQVLSICDRDIEVDMNHQLAGERLIFHISILDIERQKRAMS